MGCEGRAIALAETSSGALHPWRRPVDLCEKANDALMAAIALTIDWRGRS